MSKAEKKAWRDANPELMATYRKKWRANNPEKFRACQQKWRENNPLKIKANQLKARYGLTAEQLDGMLVKQKECCAICNKPLGGKRWIIEHSHETKFVRGIVHYKCNTWLAAVEDIEFLNNALRYLEDARRKEDEQAGKIQSSDGVGKSVGQAI